MDEESASPALELPAVIVDAEPRYLIGFPLILTVTLENKSQDTEFYELPDLDLLVTQASLALRLEPVGEGLALSMKPAAREGEVASGSMELAAGEARRMGFDLSNFGLGIRPGKYRLTVGIQVGRQSRWSDAVSVEFAQPSSQDGLEAARLRRLGGAPSDTGAWAPFLKRNWNTVRVSPSLSKEAADQCALHQYLHRAFYGPDGVAQLDTGPLARMTSPLLSVEASVLEYEIYTARNDKASRDRLAKTLLGKWPGLAYRLERVDRGEGFLTTGRRLFGAEKTQAHAPTSLPYKN